MYPLDVNKFQLYFGATVKAKNNFHRRPAVIMYFAKSL